MNRPPARRRSGLRETLSPQHRLKSQGPARAGPTGSSACERPISVARRRRPAFDPEAASDGGVAAAGDSGRVPADRLAVEEAADERVRADDLDGS